MLKPKPQNRHGFISRLGSVALLTILAVSLVAYSVLAPSVFSGWQLDMTENQQYTLSEGSRKILAELPQGIHLRLYFSETASKSLPQIRQYADDVWNVLQEMRQHSGGRLKLEKIDPEPFSEAEDDATALGLQAVPLPTGEQLYLGLVAGNELDGLQVMPFLQPDKALFLEYDLAKMISGLASPEPLRIGWLSQLQVVPHADPMTGQTSPGWEFYRQLDQLYEMLAIPANSVELPDALDLLIIAAPRGLSAQMAFSVEQYLLGGGRLLLFLDPLAERMPTSSGELDQVSGLEVLLEHWGIGFDSRQIVADLEYALQVNFAEGQKPVRHLAILGVPASGMNQEDIVSAELEVINLSSSGYLQVRENAKLSLSPLLFTSENAGLLKLEQLENLDDPADLMRDFLATGDSYILAARYQGLVSAVLAPPAAIVAEGESETEEKPPHLQAAVQPLQMIVFADSDLLDDRFWVQHQAFFQQSVSSAFADNGNLVVNAVDNLLGSEALISIRARQVTQRPFSRVEQMRFAAEQQLHEREQVLQQELQLIETRLQSMQNPEDSGALTNSEQEAEIQRFIEQRLATRKQLRQVQQSLNQEIRKLGTRLKVINILLIPALVAGLSLLYFWRRRTNSR
ncbi:MAG: Gldg family protein [Xanthomonadales bacterium]|nr:Gldg family protein [Xanthomonadales bacterium]